MVTHLVWGGASALEPPGMIPGLTHSSTTPDGLDGMVGMVGIVLIGEHGDGATTTGAGIVLGGAGMILGDVLGGIMDPICGDTAMSTTILIAGTLVITQTVCPVITAAC